MTGCRSLESTQRDVLSRAPRALLQGKNLATMWAKRLGQERARCDLTLAQWVSVCEAFGWRCAYCRDRPFNRQLVMEHMIPLSRGGDHSIENVALACSECNVRKNRFTPLEWACVLTDILEREPGRGSTTLRPGSWRASGRPRHTYNRLIYVWRRPRPHVTIDTSH